MQLTEHFSIEEFCASDTALRLGINNTLPGSLLPAAYQTARGLEAVRRLLGGVPIKINSAFRCEALERAITQKDFVAWCVRHSKDPSTAWPAYFAGKAHPKMLAVDFIAPKFGGPLAIAQKIAASQLEFDTVIEEGTWVHIAFGSAKRSTMTARFVNGTPTYTTGLA